MTFATNSACGVPMARSASAVSYTHLDVYKRQGMGYQIVDGPEVEEAAYNFTRLNIEEGHPSRDRSDTCLLYTSRCV